MTNSVTWLALGAALLAVSSTATKADKVDAKNDAPVREFDVEGFHVRVDLSGQVIGINVPEDRGFARDHNARQEAPVLPTVPATGRFVSASVLAQKAKQFDDGLYAAVEEAAQDGAGSFAGKAAMLRQVARAVVGAGTEGLGDSSTVLFAACKLGDVQVDAPREISATVQSAVNEFLADELRSKPIGFYTWSPVLSAIFRQDRMLQTELKGEAGIAALARALHANKPARATYEEYLSLVSRLTNPQSGAICGVCCRRSIRAEQSSRHAESPSSRHRGLTRLT